MRPAYGLLSTLALSAGFALGRAPEGGPLGWAVAGTLVALFLRAFWKLSREP